MNRDIALALGASSVIYKKNEEWLGVHPKVHFHFTPTSTSWLNIVEIWFASRTEFLVKMLDGKDGNDDFWRGFVPHW